MIFTLNLRTLRPLRLCGRYSEFRLRLCRAAFFAVNHSRLSWKDRCDDFIETPLHLRIVGDAPGHRDMARAAWRDPFLDQPPGINQNPRARTFFEPVLAQVPYFMTQFRQLRGVLFVHTRFVSDNFGFTLHIRKMKLQSDEALPRAVLEIFEHVLITRVV